MHCDYDSFSGCLCSLPTASTRLLFYLTRWMGKPTAFLLQACKTVSAEMMWYWAWSINLFSPEQEALNKSILRRHNLVLLFTFKVTEGERESARAFSPLYSGNSRCSIFQEGVEGKNAVMCGSGKCPGHFCGDAAPLWVITRGLREVREGTLDRVRWQGLGVICRHLLATVQK